MGNCASVISTIRVCIRITETIQTKCIYKKLPCCRTFSNAAPFRYSWETMLSLYSREGADVVGLA